MKILYNVKKRRGGKTYLYLATALIDGKYYNNVELNISKGEYGQYSILNNKEFNKRVFPHKLEST